jgi:phenylacetate-CoA ligase
MIKKHIRSIVSRIKGTSFNREYLEVKSLNNKRKLLEFQEKCLRELLLHAYQNVPYYNKIFKEIGIVKNGEVNLSRFSEIPILTKDIIRRHQEALVSKDYKRRKWYYNSSGGSTGEPLRFIQDTVYNMWGNAAFFYYYNDILGIDEPNAKKVILWGSERDIFQGGMGLKAKVLNWLSNTIFLNSFKMTKQDIHRYIEIINSYKPDLIRGYASSLYELCLYADYKGIKMHTPKAVVSSAETLTDYMRREIEKVFNTKVYNFYGSREANNLAGECREGLMHIFSFHNYIEILNDADQPVKDDEEGRVIVTNLHNYSMPLIRYEIGDMAILGPEECKCGNLLPTLRKITGRITDHFIKTDGTIIHGEYFTHLFYLKDWIKAFQVIQEDYTKIRVLVALKDEVNNSEKEEIESKIRLVMGKDCQITWEFVDEIPKTLSGKYLYTKSLVRSYHEHEGIL